MIQSRLTSNHVKIDLIPMQIPEALPGAALAFTGADFDVVTGNSLLMHPGQPSEMIVQVKNLTENALELRFRVEGNFPQEWCQIGTEGSEILPREEMQAVLYFQIPASFFEDQQAISPGKDRLELNFRCSVHLHLNPGTEQEQIETSDAFNIFIRPWSLYMEFLPLLYREVDFIGRFMNIFEQTYQPVVDSFNVMWANIDSLTAPQTLLPFLAYWVGWEFDSVQEIPQQRRLIRRAIELYRWRGTRKGLRLYLHLYTGLSLDEDIPNEDDKHISITEPLGNSFTLNQAELGNAVLGGGQAYHFVVKLRQQEANTIHEGLIRRIIEQEKPAFCTYDLYIENSDN
ncbi:phage tail protein [Plectonema cf. radiosum LEGE 06105]|uniref:Phage tail protein n=1 Tax=Plectonema cf. radiosum LEGE 06105 TaxID=945769 RepID=A0A8J7F2P8_9CYAN|nr:phage tail protein [Plectonema radiosum]MBE9215053.1 phage tail protein [Plectonema cf. radiosum LEGE 06105]